MFLRTWALLAGRLLAAMLPAGSDIYGLLGPIIRTDPPEISGARRDLRGPPGSQGPAGISGARRDLRGPPGSQGPAGRTSSSSRCAGPPRPGVPRTPPPSPTGDGTSALPRDR